MINIEWIEGAPDKLEVGMVVRVDGGEPLLIGHNSTVGNLAFVTHWAWLIKPYQLNWIDSKTGAPKR